MTDMTAIVITRPGAPDVLAVQRVPRPTPLPGHVVIRVRAFGVNHAEAYFRAGAWGEVARITGIECAGEVADAGGTGLAPGTRVIALLGGMGRTIDGSYAEYVRVPASNVVAVESTLGWAELAALPVSYATAWTFLHQNLALAAGQTLVVRGGTSALGQAAINVARGLDARVIATTRAPDKAAILEALGAEPWLEDAALSAELRRRIPGGVDAVLDVTGTATLADSLRMARYGGRVALAGFLGGGRPIALDPLRELPSGVQLSFFASAFVLGGPDLPLSAVPFAELIARAERGIYRARPAHRFALPEIVAAHELLESGRARGKIVVEVGERSEGAPGGAFPD